MWTIFISRVSFWSMAQYVGGLRIYVVSLPACRFLLTILFLVIVYLTFRATCASSTGCIEQDIGGLTLDALVSIKIRLVNGTVVTPRSC